jgi:hypothetical protein
MGDTLSEWRVAADGSSELKIPGNRLLDRF